MPDASDFGVNPRVDFPGCRVRRRSTPLVKRAMAVGLDPYLVIFLSEVWAELMKLPRPEMTKI